jgi:hypothetical protein
VNLVAVLNGNNEVPTADTDGAGVATVTLNVATGQVCTVLQTSNIHPITGYHIHQGAAGDNGGIVVNFNPTGGPTDFSTCVNAAVDVVALIAANPSGFYVNAHTDEFPDGAIRGQLVPAMGTVGGLVMLPEPVRVYDSRTADGPLAVDTTRAVDLTKVAGATDASQMAVPPGASAALVTLTVTETGNGGYLRLYSNALIGQPSTSTINWTAPDSDVATTTTVSVDASGKVMVAAGGSDTQFIVDVIGYYSLLGSTAMASPT